METADSENLDDPRRNLLQEENGKANSGRKLLLAGIIIVILITACAIVGVSVYFTHQHLLEKEDNTTVVVTSTSSPPQIDPDHILPLNCLWIKEHRANSTKFVVPSNWTDSDSDRYFHAGCKEGNLSIVRQMTAEWGQKIVDMGDDRDKDRTCLMFAAGRGQLEIAKYLIEEKGADVNMGNSVDERAIHRTVYDLEMVRYLTSKGAKINTMTSVDLTGKQCEPHRWSWTLLDEAIDANQTEFADFVIGIGGKRYCYVTQGCYLYRQSWGLGWDYAPKQ